MTGKPAPAESRAPGTQPAGPEPPDARESLTTIRRSDELHPSRGILIGVSLWLAVGVFALFDSVVAGAGSNTPGAYMAVLLFMIPTALSHWELRSWLGRTGGSYRLVKATERAYLSYMCGWLYLLGWAALSALLALAFADYAAQLTQAIAGYEVDQLWFVAGLLAVFTVLNMLGRRPSWNLGMTLVSVGTATVVIVTFRLGLRAISQSAPTRYGTAPPGVDLYGAVLMLVAAAWLIELTTRPDRRSSSRASLVALAAGPLLGMLFAMAARWAEPSLPDLVDLAGVVSPFTQYAVLAVGAVVSAVAWQITALLMLRSLSSMAHDGVFPAIVTRRLTKLGTPAVLIIGQVALTLVLVVGLTPFDGNGERLGFLAELAGVAFLLVQIAVGFAAIVLADHPRAARRAVRLPLHPMVPAVGMAACAVLVVVADFSVLVVVGAWLALSIALYYQHGRHRMRLAQMGVTVFQDTTVRPPVASNYAVIVPVAEPATSHSLVEFASRVARAHNGHVVILNVVVVGEQLPLGAAREDAQRSLASLDGLMAHAESLGVPVEGVSRLARSRGQGILDTVIEENAQLVVVGWHVIERPDGRREFTELLNELMGSAACSIAMLRGVWSGSVKKILVPIGGGPNAPAAAQLGLSVTAVDGGSVTLLNVARSPGPDDPSASIRLLNETRQRLSDPDRAEPRVVVANTATEGILSALEEHDALLVGATDPGFLDSSSADQLPIRLAERIEKPLAVVRGPIGVSRVVARRAWHSLADALPTLDGAEQRELYKEMARSAAPTVNFFVLISLSAMIATLGLLLNSVAVIIGAMLVAPLMGPIVATASGIAFGNVRMLRNGALTTLQGSLLAVFIALFTTLITPMAAPTSEILARTNPTILDLLVALVSGAAGAYVLARKEVSDALPGVAIAAALMPPLCVVGIGAALFDSEIIVGSTLLYGANLVAIVFSSAVVFLLLGVRPPNHLEQERWLLQGLRISVIALVVIAVPLTIAFARSALAGSYSQKTMAVVSEHVQRWRADPTSEADHYIAITELTARSTGLWEVTVSGVLNADRAITPLEMAALERDLDREIRPDVNLELFVIQGTMLEGATGMLATATAAAEQTPYLATPTGVAGTPAVATDVPPVGED
ncbi:MAG: DUF389 domain-containing protein [Anaerolineae bacterium]